MAKIINFFDGAQTVTVPTIGNIEASSLSTYANDAAFEAANGAGESGDVYINTTDNVIRYWNDNESEWQSILSAGGVVDATNIADGSVSNTEFQYINSLTSNAQTQLNTNASNTSTVASNLANHIADTTSAHQAEAIEVAPFGNLAADDVQSALLELQADVDTRLLASEKGAASGVAPLNGSSKIDSTYLPSYVDDVEEYANLASFPVSGETGKIYVAIDSGFIYRWTGSVYVQVASSSGANTALSNLITTSINQTLLPDTTNTRNLGSSTLQWADAIARKISSYDSGGVNRGTLDAGITLSSASTTAITGALQLPHASGAAFAVQTQASATNDAVATNPLYFETGSKTHASSTGSTGLMQFRTGSSEGGNSGSIEFVTGGVNAGNSGSMNFTTGAVSGGNRGAMTFSASGLTVNTSTINITGEFSNHIKSQFASLTVGTTSAPFGTHYAASGFNLITSGVDRLKIDNTNSQTTPYGLTVNTSIRRPYQDSDNRSLAIFTESNATVSAVSTGDLMLETGNKTAGTGSSGQVVVSSGTSSGSSSGNVIVSTGNASSFSGDVQITTGPGTSNSGAIKLETGASGTRGQIAFIDGTEGTAGHVWTSTGTLGEGSWQAAALIETLDTVTVSATNSDSLDASTNLELSRIGRQVTMTWQANGITGGVSTGVMYFPALVPSTYRPTTSIYQTVPIIYNGTPAVGMVYITTAGNVNFYVDVAATDIVATDNYEWRGFCLSYTSEV